MTLTDLTANPMFTAHPWLQLRIGSYCETVGSRCVFNRIDWRPAIKSRRLKWIKKTVRSINIMLERRLSIRVIRTGLEHPTRTGIEQDAVAALNSVKGRTMADETMQYATYSAARYVAQAGIPGAVVECGVWRGGCSMLMALGLMSASDTAREMWLFDTFEGMTSPGNRDTFLATGATADSLLLGSERVGESPSEWTIWCVADEPDVMQGMAQTGYPRSQIRTIRGPVEDTLFDPLPPQISIARLDTDWYSSTKMEMKMLYDKIAAGGVLILDDYDHWTGAREAVDEFFAERGITPFLIRVGFGRVHIKC